MPNGQPPKKMELKQIKEDVETSLHNIKIQEKLLMAQLEKLNEMLR